MALSKTASGWLNGTIGMVLFSGSLPATRLLVRDMDPLFATLARATLAGLVALAVLVLSRQPRPRGAEWGHLVVTALGVVLGFPLLTNLALTRITAGQGLLIIALLPLTTAIFAVLRGGERPRPAFWLFAVLGSAVVMAFALTRTSGPGERLGSGLMVAAVIVCGLGYAEGARLSRTLGGWQVICWALLLSLPVMAVACVITMPPTLAAVSLSGWFSLAYVALFSQLIGFIFWYRGLSEGGIASVGQLQLLQPFIGLLIAAVLLGEVITTGMIVALAGVIACVAAAKRFA